MGGAVGYASIDKDFRKNVEEAVPGASGLFSLVLGEPEPEKPVKKVSNKIPVTSVPPSKLKPRPEAAAVPAPPLEKPALSTSAPSEDSKSVKKEEKSVEQPPTLEKPSFVEASKPAPAKPEPVKKVEDDPRVPPEIEDDDDDDEVIVRAKKRAETDTLLLDDHDQADLEGSSVMAEKDLHRRITQIKDNLEAQMVRQLKRQAEAHADHIADSLEVQRKELTRKFIRELDESLEKAALLHKDELAALLGHLRGLEDGLDTRSKMDVAALEAEELWLASTALSEAVNSRALGTKSIEAEIATLQQVLDRQHDEVVEVLLQAVPEAVKTNGVATESALKDRFPKVEKMAKRTALLSDGESASLFKYLLSYLQSLLIITPPTVELPDKNAKVDLETLTTFDIVWLARGSMDHGDLEQAVRYLSLLQGEPRNVAKDWVRDARHLLETRLACEALKAHAAAIGVEALPQRK